MTPRELSALREKCRAGRRKLKRYAYTQSFGRLSDRLGDDEGPGFGGTVAARNLFGLGAALLFGIGLYFVIF